MKNFSKIMLSVSLALGISISASAQQMAENIPNIKPRPETVKPSVPLQFRNIGQSRGGRVTAVAGVVTRENVFYMGATGGGLWKTSDYGFHWKNISDGFFATPSIGAIAVCQENPDIVYVGNGSDVIRSIVIVGKSIYKSDGVGITRSFSGLKNAGQIGSVIIHPVDPGKVYAAVIGQHSKSQMIEEFI